MYRRAKYYFSLCIVSRKYLALRCLFFIILFFYTETGFTQWRKIFDFTGGRAFVGTPRSIYFLDNEGMPNIGFCGVGVSVTTSFIARTSDGGKTWTDVGDIGADITAFTFKDSLIGWIATVGGDIFKTTDGGITWFRLLWNMHNCSCIYYQKFTHQLLLSRWDKQAVFSTDEGLTWNNLQVPDVRNTVGSRNGIAFSDDLIGMISVLDYSPPTLGEKFIFTSDGGLTWYHSSLNLEAWQPLAIKNSNIFFTVGDGFGEIYRSDDGGQNWQHISTLSDGTYSCSGMIAGDLNRLYIQYDIGMFISNDQGLNWLSICGPAGSPDNRFYIEGNKIFAGDQNSGLWENFTGKANGPRLQIANQTITASSGAIIPVQINYPNEGYYENVDSVTFTLRWSGQMLGFAKSSPAPGWQNISCTATDSSVTCTMQYTGASQPGLNSPVAAINFQTYISKDTASTVTLDEINFNQDVTFRDCMVSSLTKTDSLFVSVNSQCGDSILKNFLNGVLPMKILSVHPNPAQDEIIVDVQSPVNQDATIEIYNALGQNVFSQKTSISYTTHIDTRNLSGGVYLLKINSETGSVSQSFVKIR
jgi:photosystem II stability/assembly factor-like uncharacterized protein